MLSLAVYGHNFHNYHIIALIFSISIVQNACNHFIFSTSVLLFIIVILACPAGGRGSFVGQLPTPPPLIPGMGPASCACSIKEAYQCSIVQNACCHFFMYPPWRGISLLLYYLPSYYLTPILQCGGNDMFVFSIHDCPALACTVTVFTVGIPYCAGVVSFFSFMFPHFVSFVHLINPPFVWLIDLISSVVPTSLFV